MDYLKDNTDRILAIDYGTKRIGLAISDPLKLFATPIKTLNNDNKLFDNLKKIFSEYVIIKIIIGYPLKEDGSKTNLTDKIEAFANKLKNKFKVDFEFIDERYSSSIAWEQILQTVPSKKKRRDKSLIDRNAAAVILDDYLKNLK